MRCNPNFQRIQEDDDVDVNYIFDRTFRKTCSHPGPITLARTWWISRPDAISNPAAARESLVKRCAERPKKTPDGAVPVRRK